MGGAGASPGAGNETVAVIGGGLMGHGLAQVFAEAGHAVRVFDTSADVLATLQARVRQNLLDLGRTPGAEARVTPCATIPDAVATAGFVFECGPEKLAIKQDLFAQVEAAAPRDAILASNTSVMPITQIMERVRHGERALGTHWWNPPYLVPLVEVVKTPRTGDAAVERVSALLRSSGKTPVTVLKDVPGFVGNRMQHALWREAIAIVAEGICDAETVDTVVKASFGRRLAVLGPLENADLVGTDLTLAIHETVLPAIDHEPGPSPYLRELVAQGKLGWKSGEGFRSWTPEQQAAIRRAVFTHLKSLIEQGI
jgi:3-hydroxybutyryl-CoA dehydrogenase